MTIKKNLFTIFIILTIAFSAGCSEKKMENAENIAREYLDSLLERDYHSAYNLISEETKSEVSFIKYLEHKSLQDSYMKLLSYEINGENKTGKETVDVMFKQKTEYFKGRTQEVLELDNNLALVIEDGSYKVELNNFNRDISESYLNAVWELKVSQELIDSEAHTFLENALKYDDNNPRAYYMYAYVLYEEGKYQESMIMVDRCLELSEKEDFQFTDSMEELKRELENKGVKSDNKIISEKPSSDTENIKTYKDNEKVTDSSKLATIAVWGMKSMGENREVPQESKDFMRRNKDLFTSDKNVKSELVDENITYKHIKKSPSKYTTSLFKFKGKVFDILEEYNESYGTVTQIHIIDDETQIYKVVFTRSISSIFEGDLVEVIGLPLGISYEEGVQKPIISAGSYIEKIQ